MRLFDLFMRRAGVDRGALNRRPGTSRLTIECPRDALGAVRKQICLDFGAAGLDVAQFQIDSRRDADFASACITVNCPPELRPELMSQARRLRANPAVRHVHFGTSARA
ncbi:hypothetical protein [Bordetella petrii]|uniref:Uncharacterized protein n=1 Tax=Bordetella petrii (strain ATCC BAA-461 / DSM 12804 / CCUG 43448 / CIP 107267 / Se-1111R) TaxID=340100 RepID=A9I8H5_BORPD|nr:hypothetical protein [Bordetella petrii]CAP41245.1 hypothetical protein Bpet0914 [Bordetella petrii]